MVFAVPIPKEDAADAESIQKAISDAVAEARSGITLAHKRNMENLIYALLVI